MILINRDLRNRIRCVDIVPNREDYTIHRYSNQIGCKKLYHPVVKVTSGKSGKTIDQQFDLILKSHINKYKNKGYKEYSTLTDIPFDEITVEEINKLLPAIKTDANNAIKPMLAKDFNLVSSNLLNRDWYASRKLDGVRCMMFMSDKIKTSSRGGKSYDFSVPHLLSNEILVKFFNDNPNIVLDGELYKHGMSLQKISGLCRLSKPINDVMEYWIYDYYDRDHPKLTFRDRYINLERWSREYTNKDFSSFFYIYDSCKVKFLPHVKVNGFAGMELKHDLYVSDGFEGVVIRDPSKVYTVGNRSAAMLKIKQYKDSEFEIVGIEEGVRPEDMTFVCVTKDNKKFKAKPIGSRDLKDKYHKDIDTLIGKKATIKFFYYSNDGIPLQPVLKTIRDYE
jgi:DNA ligase-1